VRAHAQELVRRILHWNGIDDAQATRLVVAKAMEFENDSDMFARWSRWPESPIRWLSGQVHQLIAWTVWSDTFAVRAEENRNEDGPRQALPFLWIDCYGCRAHDGSFLDGFCAHRDDPIWKELTAPFDWSCGCGIRCGMVGDPEVKAGSEQPAAGRIDRKLVDFVIDWPNRMPNFTEV
jgi:hypothetical protein